MGAIDLFTIESIFLSHQAFDSIENLIIKLPTLIIVPVGRVGNSIFRAFDLWSSIFQSYWSFNLFDLSIFSIFRSFRSFNLFYLSIFLIFQSFRSFNLFDLLIFSIFKKYRPWSNPSRRSFKKIDRDQIDPIDLYKKLTVRYSISLIS